MCKTTRDTTVTRFMQMYRIIRFDHAHSCVILKMKDNKVICNKRFIRFRERDKWSGDDYFPSIFGRREQTLYVRLGKTRVVRGACILNLINNVERKFICLRSIAQVDSRRIYDTRA